MPGSDALLALLPEHLLLGGMVAGILCALGARTRALVLPLSVLVVVAAAAAAFWLAAEGVHAEPFPGQYALTPAIAHAKGWLLALALPVLLLLRREGDDLQFPLLVVCSLYGLALLPSARNALVLFLGLELLSIPVYALIVLAFRRPQAAESALKYLIMSGTGSAVFLMAMSLLYGATGSMAVEAMAQAAASADPLARGAVLLALAALLFKGAVVPFHAWAPDTYEGASIPVTAYLATLSKAAVLVVALRLFDGVTLTGAPADLVAALPLASIVWGNLAAIRQPSLRRMLAYSSIAHAGYLFYAFLGDPAGRTRAVLAYLVVYGIATLLAFAAVPPDADDARRDRLERLDGLFHRHPLPAALLAVAMLSLAGLPPFPGFTVKFAVFKDVVAAGYPVWAVLGLVGSFLGLYFYLRVIMRMFMQPAPADAEAPGASVRGPGERAAQLAGGLCLAATLLLMVTPGWLYARF
jgi:NADH-quinone oxidoreductase subunit N